MRWLLVNKIGMSITNSHRENPSIEEQIELYADTGFDSVFLSCGVTDKFEGVPVWSGLARDNGVILEAVHAPSDWSNGLWEGGGAAETGIAELKKIITYLNRGGVGKLVLHVVGGALPRSSRCGISNFKRLENYAKEYGIHLCYENSISCEHLSEILKNADEYHGFCWDSGHNLCYLPDVNFISRFKDRLMYTHLHDNFGNGKDLHLLPFDGCIDWQEVSKGLKGYDGTLNLELSCNGSEDYNLLTYREFTQTAYERVTRLKESIG